MFVIGVIGAVCSIGALVFGTWAILCSEDTPEDEMSDVDQAIALCELEYALTL